MNNDQFAEVNAVTPALVKVQSALPAQVRAPYIRALLSQANSGAWKGAPAAKRALSNLPELFEEAFSLIDAKTLWSNFQSGPLRSFLENCRGSWPSTRGPLYSDFLTLKMFDFADKHLSETEA